MSILFLNTAVTMSAYAITGFALGIPVIHILNQQLGQGEIFDQRTIFASRVAALAVLAMNSLITTPVRYLTFICHIVLFSSFRRPTSASNPIPSPIVRKEPTNESKPLVEEVRKDPTIEETKELLDSLIKKNIEEENVEKTLEEVRIILFDEKFAHARRGENYHFITSYYAYVQSCLLYKEQATVKMIELGNIFDLYFEGLIAESMSMVEVFRVLLNSFINFKIYQLSPRLLSAIETMFDNKRKSISLQFGISSSFHARREITPDTIKKELDDLLYIYSQYKREPSLRRAIIMDNPIEFQKLFSAKLHKRVERQIHIDGLDHAILHNREEFKKTILQKYSNLGLDEYNAFITDFIVDAKLNEPEDNSICDLHEGDFSFTEMWHILEKKGNNDKRLKYILCSSKFAEALQSSQGRAYLATYFWELLEEEKMYRLNPNMTVVINQYCEQQGITPVPSPQKCQKKPTEILT